MAEVGHRCDAPNRINPLSVLYRPHICSYYADAAYIISSAMKFAFVNIAGWRVPCEGQALALGLPRAA